MLRIFFRPLSKMDLGLPLVLIHLWTFSTSASKDHPPQRKVGWFHGLPPRDINLNLNLKPYRLEGSTIPKGRDKTWDIYKRKTSGSKKSLSEQPRYKSPMKPMKPCANASSQARNVIHLNDQNWSPFAQGRAMSALTSHSTSKHK